MLYSGANLDGGILIVVCRTVNGRIKTKCLSSDWFGDAVNGRIKNKWLSYLVTAPTFFIEIITMAQI